MTKAAEREVQAWLETIDASTPRTVLTMPATTIVPALRAESARRVEDFLAQLTGRGPAIELRPGKVIGEGGMGLVREAEQVALGRSVAIKTLRPGRSVPGAASDLLREAWVTGALEHPNVVPVHHLELDDDLMPLLILKRIDGVEWSKLCRDPGEVQRRFGANDLLAWNLGILIQVLHALRFAHSRGVLHRDLKPGNVMIGNFGEVYLLDWGIAVSLRDDGSGRFPLASEATELAGTPTYMAPEMLGRGGPQLSTRTDVYLAGAVLHELIAGTPPHAGANALAVIASVVLSKPVLPAEVPVELAQICTRAMQPAPADRYESIEALQLALQGYLEHRGSSRLSSGATTRLVELVRLTERHDPTQREEIYRQLAICRFAFHEALAVWRDNDEARAGLTRAAIAVAEFELACGDPRAAVTLLSELAERPALLARARAAAEAQSARQQELERIDRDTDPTVHPTTRLIVIGLGLAFTVAPAIAANVPAVSMTAPAHQVIWAASIFLILSLVSIVMYRKPMTPINHRVFDAARFMFLAQTVLAIGGWILGADPAQVQVVNIFVWGTLIGTFAISIDHVLALNVVNYYAAFLIAARFPEHRLWVMSCANLVFALTVAWRWRPAAQRLAAQRGAASDAVIRRRELGE